MLADLIDDYLDFADNEIGCTKKTLYGYRYQLIPFLKCMGNVSVSEITIESLRQYFRLEEERVKVSSVNTTRAVLRIFFKYVAEDRRIELSFSPNSIRNKKTDPPIQKVASDNDIQQTLSALDDPQDKLIVLVINQTCMRVGELVKLRVEHINGCEITTLGKGRKRRLVYITPDLAAALQKHMIENEIHSGPVFRHRVTKKSLIYKGYTVSGLRNRFIRKLEPYGLYPGFHWYRHGGATGMLRNGADLFFLKEYLGHSDIRTTQMYLHITDNEKRKKFEDYYKSPVDIARVLT